MIRQSGICIIISSFFPVVSGAERQAYQLATRLVRRGEKVWVLTRRYRSLSLFERIDGVTVHRMPAPGNQIVASLTFTFTSLLWLARNRSNWSVLHAFQLLSPTTIALIAKLALGGHVVARMACSSGGGTLYGDINHIRQGPLVNLRRRLLRHADVFVVLNEEGQRDLVEFGLGDRPVCLIPNGVDTDLFHPLSKPYSVEKRQALSLPTKGRIVGFVGRLHQSKGLDILLNAWRQASGDLAETVYLVIVGEGNLRPQLEAQISNLAQHVIFLGRRENVAEYLQAVDVFVLPSLAEGLSNALLEAMSCGLPVVATAIGGSPEVIENNINGLLVPPDDVDALSNAILHLLHHPEQAQRFGQAARQTILARYSIETAVDQYVRLYASLTNSEDEP